MDSKLVKKRGRKCIYLTEAEKVIAKKKYDRGFSQGKYHRSTGKHPLYDAGLSTDQNDQDEFIHGYLQGYHECKNKAIPKTLKQRKDERSTTALSEQRTNNKTTTTESAETSTQSIATGQPTTSKTESINTQLISYGNEGKTITQHSVIDQKENISNTIDLNILSSVYNCSKYLQGLVELIVSNQKLPTEITCCVKLLETLLTAYLPNIPRENIMEANFIDLQTVEGNIGHEQANTGQNLVDSVVNNKQYVPILASSVAQKQVNYQKKLEVIDNIVFAATDERDDDLFSNKIIVVASEEKDIDMNIFNNTIEISEIEEIDFDVSNTIDTINDAIEVNDDAETNASNTEVNNAIKVHNDDTKINEDEINSNYQTETTQSTGPTCVASHVSIDLAQQQDDSPHISPELELADRSTAKDILDLLP